MSGCIIEKVSIKQSSGVRNIIAKINSYGTKTVIGTTDCRRLVTVRGGVSVNFEVVYIIRFSK